MRQLSLILSLLTCGLSASIAPGWAAEHWPEYRGPTRDGHAEATGLPLEWSETENVAWKTAIHDVGWSSPVVYGDQIWLTTATQDGKGYFGICIDAQSGEILLDRQLFEVARPRPLGNTVNSYATPSPVIEQGRVYLNFGSYGTVCLDTQTFDTVWERRDLPCDHWRGPGSSPLLFEDLLILHMDGADVQYVVALDKQTGANRWVTFRSADYRDLDEEGRPGQDGDYRKAFNTPTVIEFEGRQQLISPSAKAAYSYDPQTGQELWHIQHDGHSSAPRTLYADGLACIWVGHVGRLARMWGVRVDGEGDVSETHVEWECGDAVSKRASAVLVDGRIYMVSNDGIATCLDFRSGQQIWRKRLGGNYSASALYADGRIYLTSEEGVTTVLAPGDTFEVLAENELDDGCMASPAVAGQAIFLRTKTHLYRIQR